MPIGEVFRHIFTGATVTGELSWDYYVIAAVISAAILVVGVIVALSLIHISEPTRPY